MGELPCLPLVCALANLSQLTHLFIVTTRHGQISMSTAAFCKTEAVQDFSSLLQQRRRWFLGFVTNEVCVLTDARVWVKYPFLCIMRIAQDTITSTTLFFFILVLALCTSSRKVEDLPVGFIVVSLGLNWILMIYLAIILQRYKIMLYPLVYVVSFSMDRVCSRN